MKRAVVTGGTKGIGFSIVEMLLREEYEVIFTYGHDDASAEDCRNRLASFKGKYEIFKVDQSDKYQVSEFAKQIYQYGTIDCVVLNAGTTFRNNTLKEIDDKQWERVMTVNVNSPFYLIRDLYDAIAPNSRIVFIASELGIKPHSMSLAYGVTKSAVIALTKNLVKYFDGTGTTVNAIAPGFIDTEWQQEKPVEIRNSICDKTALHRFGTPAEVANAVRFCINNAFLNGSVIELTGGYCYK